MIRPVLLILLLGLAACDGQKSAPSTNDDPYVVYQRDYATTRPCELTQSQRSLAQSLLGAVEFNPAGTEMFVEAKPTELASRLAAKGFGTSPLRGESNILVFSHCGDNRADMKFARWLPFREYNLLFGAELISQRDIGDVRIQNYHQPQTGANIYVLVGDGVAFLLGGPQPVDSLNDLAAVLAAVIRS